MPVIQLVALSNEERRWFSALFILLVLSAWLVLLLPGVGDYTDHGRVFSDLKAGQVLARSGPFVAAWTVMMWAMMLPSTIKTQEAVVRVSARHSFGRMAPLLFSAGYVSVWATFGVIAFAGDYLIHSLVERSAYLHEHQLIITGAVVLGAGIYQFTPLKKACMKSCRSPLAFILSRKREGARGVLLMGADHGLFCLGCCWALMLLMFAFSFSSLLLMAAMAGYFYVEKVVKNSEPVAHWTGVVASSAGVVLMLRGI
jgi:predicted metal-binding membrane protein